MSESLTPAAPALCRAQHAIEDSHQACRDSGLRYFHDLIHCILSNMSLYLILDFLNERTPHSFSLENAQPKQFSTPWNHPKFYVFIWVLLISFGCVSALHNKLGNSDPHFIYFWVGPGHWRHRCGQKKCYHQSTYGKGTETYLSRERQYSWLTKTWQSKGKIRMIMFHKIQFKKTTLSLRNYLTFRFENFTWKCPLIPDGLCPLAGQLVDLFRCKMSGSQPPEQHPSNLSLLWIFSGISPYLQGYTEHS